MGGGLLLFGRRLFWLVVGAIGFLIGLEVATRLSLRSELLLILAGLVLGAVFALMAVFLESVAIGMAGFLGGGVALTRVALMLGLDSNAAQIIVFIMGGILGAVLIVWLFNWALIGISSVAGAAMVANALFLRPTERPLVFLVLLILGVLVQGLALRKEGPPTKRPPRTAE
jgi:hypothetical protein